MNWLNKKIIGRKKYKIVSFDVFDTLIERNVKTPSDIFFSIGERVIGKEYGEIFRKDRMIAERVARGKKSSAEVDLSDIYRCLPERYLAYVDRLQEAEISEELESCHSKKQGYDLFRYCKKLGKKIIIITDMYLSQNDIEHILHKNGYEGYDSIYVSNVYECSKRKGNLYKVALATEKVNGNEMIHIGDSVKADFISAKDNGIKSLLLFRPDIIRRKLYEKSIGSKRR